MGFNKGLIISIILVSIAFISLSGFVFSVSSYYNFAIDPEFNDTFNKYSQSSDLVSTMEGTITGGSINEEGQDQAVYSNVVVAGKVSRQSAELAQDLLQETPKIIPINAAVLGGIALIIFISATFGFIAMISRRNP